MIGYKVSSPSNGHWGGHALVVVWSHCRTSPKSYQILAFILKLTYWGRVTHICVSKLTSIGSDNGLALGGCQAIILTTAGILLIRPSGANFSEILIKIHFIQENSLQNVIWKMGAILSRLQCVKSDSTNLPGTWKNCWTNIIASPHVVFLKGHVAIRSKNIHLFYKNGT